MSTTNFHGVHKVRRSGGSFIITLPKSTGVQTGKAYAIRTTGVSTDRKNILLSIVEPDQQNNFFTFAPEPE